MKRVTVTHQANCRFEAYLQALRMVGLEPVAVDPDVPGPQVEAGLLLTGGIDLNPKLYGQSPDPRSEEPDDALDSMESALLTEALERDLPVLAICRGLQLFNVHAGGSLSQHIEGHSERGDDRSRPVHTVQVKGGTVLARIMGAGEHRVNSRHHQAVMEVGRGLTISACAPDGIIEGLERPDRRFAIAVQWHPEDQAAVFPEQRRLFEAFGDAV